MGTLTKRRAAAIGMIGLGALSVQAQEGGTPRESGLRMTLDVNQELAYDSNAGLSVGGESSTSSATTALTFNLISETPIDTLQLSVGGVLRVLNSPDTSGTEGRFDDPSLRFSFERDVGHSSLSARANYARSPVEFTRPLTDFTDPSTGEIVLPDDLDDLNGDGDRISVGYSFGLELGKDAPLGLNLTASENILRYSGTTDPDLFRTERRNLGATLRADLSPVLESRLTLSRETYEADNPENTDRTTDRLNLGLTYSASEALSLRASLGYSQSETDETVAGTRSTDTEEGLTWGFGATLERPNGTVGFSFDSDVTQNARRNTIELSRALELPTGEISASIGLTRGPADKTQMIGSLDWRRDLPTGSISAQISRSVTTNNDDDERLSTAISLGYTHQITEVASFGLTASHSTSDDISGGDRSTRTTARATYGVQLTEDWNLNSGIELRRTDSDSSGSATNERIFVGLGRRFDLRP